MTTAAVPLEDHREKLLAFQAQGRSYQFLTTIDAYLAAAPDDHHVRLLAVREYLSLGLVAPAKDLLEVDAKSVTLPPELMALRDRLNPLTASPIRWTTLNANFEGNLSALAARGFDADAIRKEWSRRGGDFRLFRDKHGVHQVRRRTPRGWRWFPYLGNHLAVDDARPLPEGIGGLQPGPFVFEGLGMGRFLERVYAATKDSFLGYSCALFLVERDAAALSVALHVNDWHDILADPRVLLFTGTSALDQLRRAWDEDLDLPFPAQSFTVGESAGATQVVIDAASARENAIRQSLAELERRYAPRTVPHWARRFREALAGSPPLRVLAAVSIHTTFLQHSMRDARRAIEALGHRCQVLSEPNAHSITGPLTFHNAIRDFDPDVFFVLDHLRPEFTGILPTNLPILTWDQDQLPHVFTRANLRRIAPHDFIVGCSKSHCLAHGCDPRQLLYARVPTCPEQFSGDPLTPDESARYACDVSYVSHASQTAKAFHEQERAAYDHPKLKELLDDMYERLPSLLQRYRVVDGGVMSTVLAEGCQAVGTTGLEPDVEERLRGWYLWRLGDRMFRHEALEWVAEWARRTDRSFRIYGRGWEQHPTLAPFAAGPADNGRELLCIHRASRINLQLMPAGFIHQRSLDGLAAGGFFVTRLCPSDLRGRTLRRLDARVRELGIETTGDLLEHPDPDLQPLLRGYVGDWLGRMDHHKYDLLQHIRLNAEVHSPDEVFPDFPSIVFDSAEQFGQVAERFLSDERSRRDIAERMRAVVVERFDYRSTMDRFFGAMSGYLQTLADAPPASQTQAL